MIEKNFVEVQILSGTIMTFGKTGAGDDSTSGTKPRRTRGQVFSLATKSLAEGQPRGNRGASAEGHASIPTFSGGPQD